MWAPLSLLFCGKRGAEVAPEDAEGKRRVVGRAAALPADAAIAKIVDESLAAAWRSAAGGVIQGVDLSLQLIGTQIAQDGKQERLQVVFEWAVASGSVRIVERWVGRAVRLPKVVPLPDRCRAALRRCGLQNVAAESQRDAEARHVNVAGFDLRCAYLGALKENCTWASGACEDPEAAAASFEPDPLLWPHVAKGQRESHRPVAAMWSCGEGAEAKHWVAFASMHNLLSHGQRWCVPEGIYRAHVEQLLRQKAQRESATRGALCSLVRIRWPDDDSVGTSARGEAIFEFGHAFVDPERTQHHQVAVRLDHALQRERQIPRHPLCTEVVADHTAPARSASADLDGAPPAEATNAVTAVAYMPHVAIERESRQARREHNARWATSRAEVNGVMETIAFRRPLALSARQWPDAPGVLYYSPGFFNHLAASLSGELWQEKFTYEGTMRSGDPAFVRKVPLGNYALDADAWWLWPYYGHCLCIPARKLAALTSKDLQMLAENKHPAWRNDYKVLKKSGYSALGIMPKDSMDSFLRNPGLNVEHNWFAYKWFLPRTHLEDCWWITNSYERDAPPALLSRSLVELTFDLGRGGVDCVGDSLPGAHLVEQYEVKLSGILAVDRRTMEQLVAQEEEELLLKRAEATCLG